MKILVLTPCNGLHVNYTATIIKDILEKKSDSIEVFSIPMYVEYLVAVGKVKDKVEGFFYAMRAAEYVYNQRKKPNLIIFGNMSKKFDFDSVFNFQEDKVLQYTDFFIQGLNEAIKPDGEDDSAYQFLSQFTTNLHEADESCLTLVNPSATSEFLVNYCNAEVEEKLERLKQNFMTELEKIDIGCYTNNVRKIG